MLPGALLGNLSQAFICKDVFIRDQSGYVQRLPIAHGEGRYWINEKELARLEGDGQIAYQYCSPAGVVSAEYNPNGSTANIAAIYSKSKKVLGMMPHPERATEPFIGKTPDGLAVMSDFLRQI
jgi:phosphoribosylformylglycinamidine synthase